MQIKEASSKWNISERRIRKLIEDGRIEGAFKVGTTWNIPDDTSKPIDKRKKENEEFTIDLDDNYFDEVNEKLKRLNKKRPLSKEQSEVLHDAINLEWTFNSIAIENNPLTLKETKVVLEGITVGGKTIKDHLEAINHEYAIEYLEELFDKELRKNVENIEHTYYVSGGINNQKQNKDIDIFSNILSMHSMPKENGIMNILANRHGGIHCMTAEMPNFDKII